MPPKKNKKKGRGRPRKKLGRRLSLHERSSIVALSKNGFSQKQLAKKYKTGEDTVRNLLIKFEETGSVQDRPGRGRKRKTTPREDRHIYLHARSNPSHSSRYIAQNIVPTFAENEIGRTAVQERLREWGLKPYVARKKPLLSQEQKQKRFEWAKEHLDWTVEDWKKVAFSDETPLCLFQSYGRKINWIFPGEQFLDKNISPTVKHGGGKIQVWGIFSYWGAGPLHRIKGIMDGEQYRQILIHHMAPHVKYLEDKTGIEIIFQQDNDPKHTCNKVKNYLKNKQMRVLKWVSQSPDINPIENGWRMLKLESLKESLKPRT